MNPFMKRTTSVVLAATLVLPLSPAFAASLSFSTPFTSSGSSAISTSPAFTSTRADASNAEATDAKLTRTEALEFARKYAQLPAGMRLTNASFRASDQWRPFPEWSFYWTNSSEGKPDSLSISVSVNADSGELTSYGYYENDRTKSPSEKRMEAAEAEQIARQFLQKVAESKASQVTLHQDETPKAKPPLSGNVTYNFTYVQLVENIPFLNNQINISVNGEGKVTSYNLSWDDNITFSKPDDIIDQSEAGKTFRDEAKARPAFLIPWESFREEQQLEARLVYHSPFSFYIDANTGEALTHTLTPRKLPGESVPVSKQQLSPLHRGAEMTQAEAVKLAQSLFDLAGYQLRSVNYHEYGGQNSRSVWGINFEKEGKTAEQRSFIYINLDAKTGDVLNYSVDMAALDTRTDTQQKPKMSVEQAQKRAVELVRKWSPTVASELYLREQNDIGTQSPSYYSVQFERLVNGIPAATGTASLSFDLMTGTLRYYYVDRGNEKYPQQLPDHLSAEEAVDKWLEEAKVELVYVAPSQEIVINRNQANDSKPEAKLVYRVITPVTDHPYVLDAVSGDWISMQTGQPIMIHRVKPEDVDGHPAEKALLLMYEYDAISLIDGKIMPNRPITRGEMIEMLVITFNQGRFYPQQYASRTASSFADVSNSSPYFAYVEAAVEQGLLEADGKALKPDEEITRAELAKMLVRGLGYSKLAEHDDLFATTIKDITNKQDRGAIAIITSLGIMTAEQQQFRPNDVVSRADAAVAFSRFLDKRPRMDNHSVPPYVRYY